MTDQLDIVLDIVIPTRPKRYDEVKFFVGTKRYITHTMIELKFNLRYVESRELIMCLKSDRIISDEFDVKRGGYEVFQKTYQVER